MLKPEDFKLFTPDNSEDVARIEAAVEERLRAGYLTVDGGRSGWSKKDVEQVADKYRALGWQVATGGKCAFVFALPR